MQRVFFLQDLSNNSLESAGAEHVAKVLLDNISLKSMKLSGNVNGTDGCSETRNITNSQKISTFSQS